MITIVDYGMGNLGSIQNMLKRVGVPCVITSDIDAIEAAEKVILPGVGAFDTAMNRINAAGMRDVLDHKALVEKVPVLGICLGMQLLTRCSDEGNSLGLNWVPAVTHRFAEGTDLKVPHMGWNQARPAQASALTADFDDDTRFYFVHSYFVTVDEPDRSILKTTYGIEFDSGVQHENIFGVQFHPEKSHRYGMKLLKRFAEI